MLSIVPFDHRLNAKDTDRPFKAYHRPSSTLSGSSYYSPYQQSYMSSAGYERRTADTMDLRPPPAHMYQQTSHHMLDMSMHSSRRDVKLEHDNMYGDTGVSGMSHIHQGYSTPDLSTGLSGAMGNMSAHMPTTHGLLARTTSSISPPATTTTTNVATTPPDHQTSENSSDSSSILPMKTKVPPKKRALSVPEDLKDDGYWDKRKKNNESAKRSRESRRMKEEQIAMRVVYLEQENLQLRTETSLLKGEIEKLRCMLYNS